jgi:hypothetical protein
MSEKARFSKDTLRKFIQQQVDCIQRIHAFDPDNGYAQVMRKEVATVVAYGEFHALCRVADEYELAINQRGNRQ